MGHGVGKWFVASSPVRSQDLSPMIVSSMLPARRPRTVVVGAGFGGLAAIQRLDARATDLVLIDRTNHHLFQPLLYQVATAALSPAEIATATRTLVRGDRARVVMAEVTGIDLEAKAVLLANGMREPFDRLIIAVGSRYSYFGHSEWAKHALTLKTLPDALAIRNQMLGRFETAVLASDPTDLSRLLTFVVVGGGPTGVELAGTIAEFIRAALPRDFPMLPGKAARVILCEGGDRLLAPFSDTQSAYTAKALAGLGVELRLGHQVEEIAQGQVRVNGETIATDTVLWCAGTAPLPVAEWLGLKPAKGGGVAVDADCAVPGHPDIFVIGDCAHQLDVNGKPLPALAPVAKQQGHHVAAVINARLASRRAPKPFRYLDWGTLAVIGRSRAVATFGSMRLQGTLAWMAWALIHLGLLIDFRSRLLVYIDWAWEWLHGNRADRLILAPRSSDGPHE